MAVLLWVAVFLLAVFVYGLRPLDKWRFRKFSGPKAAWLIGCANAVFSDNQIFMFQKYMQDYGPKAFAVSLGAESMVVVSDPDDVRTALLHCLNRPNMDRNSAVPRQYDLDSMLWARDEKWRSLRAAWQPVFFSGSLKGYMKIMDDAADLLVDEIAEQGMSKEKYFNIYPMIQAMSMNVIGQSAFGVELHTQKCDKTVQSNEEKERSTSLLKAARDALTPVGNSIWVILAQLFPFMVPFIRLFASRFPDPILAHFIRGKTHIDNVVYGLLEDHEAAVKDDPNSKPLKLAEDAEQNTVKSVSSNDKENSSTHNLTNKDPKSALNGGKSLNDGRLTHVPEIRKGVQPGSFIDLLVRGSMRDTGELFTENEKAQQVLLLLLAGYDTSASSLASTTYSLARPRNAEMQRRIVQEVDALGPNYTYDDLESKVPYMDAVIKESLRLYPPGHLVLRDTSEDLKLKGRVVPKGTFLSISVYGIHHEKSVWGDDADEFVPDRWLTEDVASQKRSKNSYFAFGGGMRSCPGKAFALLEIKCTLIKVFQNFTLELGPKQEPLQLRSTLTLGPRNGVFVRAIPRAKAN